MSEQDITVYIDLEGNGNLEALTMALEVGDTVESIRNEVRFNFGVIEGILSQCQHSIKVVRSLRAGGVYYFLRFRFPNSAQPNSARKLMDYYAGKEKITNIVLFF